MCAGEIGIRSPSAPPRAALWEEKLPSLIEKAASGVLPQPRRELDAVRHARDRLVLDQIAGVVRAMCNGEARDTGCACHLHVMRGVSDHERALGRDVERVDEPLQHGRVGL